MGKGLGRHSFLKSAEEYEKRGVNFVRFAAKSEKSEKSEGAEIGGVDIGERVRLAAIMGDCSTIVTDCQ